MNEGEGIWWLASYPRSGNTWVRVMLHAYFRGIPERTRDVAAWIPDLHVDGEFDAAQAPSFAKTHFFWGPSHPAADRTAGAIVIIRHPRDVLLSCMDFHGVLGTRSNFGEFRQADFCRLFIEAGGDPIWMSQGFGTWEQFHTSWLEGGLKFVLVRYEDLKTDAAGQLCRVLEGLGERVDEARFRAAVRAGRFDAMRAMEVREKARSDKPHTFFGGHPQTFRKGHRFMKSGRVGASLEPVAPGLDRLFAARFAAATARFGYGPIVPAPESEPRP